MPPPNTDLAKLKSENAELTRRVRQAEKSFSSLALMAPNGDLLPPEPLRLHVGTTTAATNFYAQGAASAHAVVSRFGHEPAGPVLDWGCGSGRTRNWLRMSESWRKAWHGCDVDAEAIDWLASRGETNVQLCTDQPALPYPDSYFAGIYSFSVLTHIPPEVHEAWYEELCRILRPGGYAFLTTQGDAVMQSGRAGGNDVITEYAANGYIFLDRIGHYKSAALVSLSFTRQRLERFFSVIENKSPGYNNMETWWVRKDP